MDNYKYRMLIEWSDEDNCYLVALPDFPGDRWRTHGETYLDAVKNGQEAIESLIITYESLNEKLPTPKTIISTENIEDYEYQINLKQQNLWNILITKIKYDITENFRVNRGYNAIVVFSILFWTIFLSLAVIFFDNFNLFWLKILDSH